MRIPTNLSFGFHQSSLELGKCLHAFHARHLLKKDKWTGSEAATFGTQFHELTKIYTDRICADGYSLIDLEIAEEVASTYPHKVREMFLDWARRTPIDYDKVFATEYTVMLRPDLSVRVARSGLKGYDFSYSEAPFRGTLDMVEFDGDGGCTITDYKTTLAVFQPDTIQSYFYPWLLSKVFPRIEYFTFRLSFVRYGAFRAAMISREQLPEIERHIMVRIKPILDAWKSNWWPANAGKQCAYCRLRCPLENELVENTSQVGSPEEAQRAAERLYAIQRKADQIQHSLSVFAGKEGGIELPKEDMVLEHRQKAGYNYSADDIARLNQEYGLPILTGLSADKTALKRIFKKMPAYEYDLKEVSAKATSTEFRFHKKEKTDDD